MFNMNLFPYCEKIYTSYNSTRWKCSVRISKFDFGKVGSFICSVKLSNVG